METPASFQVLYPAEEISKQVARLGAEITAWAKEVRQKSHTDILAIPILKGGIFFFSDLVRRIDSSVEIAPTRIWAYDVSENTARQNIKLNIEEVPARGRAVLIVDDICDSGRTLAALHEALYAAGAQSVRSAVLIKRVLPRETFNPDWVGFSHKGPEWFVGYGMDDCDRFRNLSGIYVIRQPE